MMEHDRKRAMWDMRGNEKDGDGERRQRAKREGLESNKTFRERDRSRLRGVGRNIKRGGERGRERGRER